MRLSTTEYVKQRALGYEPRGIPPDALFTLIEKISELEDKKHIQQIEYRDWCSLERNYRRISAAGKGVMRYGCNRILACISESESDAGLRRQSRQDHATGISG